MAYDLCLEFVPVCDDFATEVDHSGTPGGGRVFEGALQVIHSLVCNKVKPGTNTVSLSLLARYIKRRNLIGEGENTRVAIGGDTQVRHPVPYGGHGGVAEQRKEHKGHQHHLASSLIQLDGWSKLKSRCMRKVYWKSRWRWDSPTGSRTAPPIYKDII